ncbi:beta-galactosidase family protein [Microbacterium sp. X-17]|uniref:glycoside hydrolase family 35 protein n=1 Tax=Microbacterium sp. X-17 TaxID=3144404 RepID=UPI0031F4F0D1
MTSFTIGRTDFLLDGQPFRILSGALHYFRVHPEHWAQRIRMARLMGLNTIETYVAWNAHEPRRGAWDATGWNDLGAFLDAVAAEGMYAIVRPGPYICGEWHNGGLPVWLTRASGIGLRSSEPRYLAEVSRYLRHVYEIVAPRQIDAGGNVILVQVENEYGAYGDDKDYLAELVRVTRDAGITVPLTTVDQPTPQMLRDGALPGLHVTGSFGSRAHERLRTLREHQPTGPLMCAEFWDGWFDWWGGHHHATAPADTAAELDTLLAAGASVNLYMFHGGTNFGLTNGANDKGRYLPLVTSYDYDAPLDEAGHPTEKFFAFREVIARYAPVPALPPLPDPVVPSLDVPLRDHGDWLAAIDPAGATTDAPPTFEQLQHLDAIAVYTTVSPLLPAGDSHVFAVEEVRDHAWIEVDGEPVGSLSRTRHQHRLRIPAGSELTVVVEEQGRVNYGHRLGEHKGLIGAVTLDGVPLTGWTAATVDLHAIARRVAREQSRTPSPAGGIPAGRVALRGEFTLDEASDLFLDTRTWGKGYVFVNDFLLGRYWHNGPQRTLFVPAPVVQAGTNVIVVLELEQVMDTTARFTGEPDLGPVEE